MQRVFDVAFVGGSALLTSSLAGASAELALEAGAHHRAVSARRHHRHRCALAGRRAAADVAAAGRHREPRRSRRQRRCRAVAKSPNDGYTLLMGTVGTHAINAALFAQSGNKMPFDPVKDFVPITLAAGVPNVMVINPSCRRTALTNSSRTRKPIRAS